MSLEAENKSSRTIRGYCDAVRFFRFWLANPIAPTEADSSEARLSSVPTEPEDHEPNHIWRWIADRLATTSPGTANNNHRAFSVWFTRQMVEHEIEHHPVARMNPPHIPEQPIPSLRWNHQAGSPRLPGLRPPQPPRLEHAAISTAHPDGRTDLRRLDSIPAQARRNRSTYTVCNLDILLLGNKLRDSNATRTGNLDFVPPSRIALDNVTYITSMNPFTTKIIRQHANLLILLDHFVSPSEPRERCSELDRTIRLNHPTALHVANPSRLRANPA